MNYVNYNKFKSNILKCSNKSIFHKFFGNFFFFIYVKISENLSAKCYQENKRRLQKRARERYQNLSKEEKEKSYNMVLNVTEISQKMKNKSLLSIEKNIIQCEKMLYYT